MRAPTRMPMTQPPIITTAKMGRNPIQWTRKPRSWASSTRCWRGPRRSCNPLKPFPCREKTWDLSTTRIGTKRRGFAAEMSGQKREFQIAALRRAVPNVAYRQRSLRREATRGVATGGDDHARRAFVEPSRVDGTRTLPGMGGNARTPYTMCAPHFDNLEVSYT